MFCQVGAMDAVHSDKVWQGLTHGYSPEGIGYYFRAGSGPVAVVLIHGMGGSARNWRLVVSLLPADLPLILIDLPWCATSTAYHGASSPDGLVDAVSACVSQLWPGRVIVAAHSIGGFFGWTFRELGTTSVDSLVLVSADLFSLVPILRHPLRLGSLRLRITLFHALLLSLLKPPRFLRAATSHSSLVRHIIMWPLLNAALIGDDAEVGECFEGNGGVGGVRMIMRSRTIDLLKLAATNLRPTVLIYGAKDPLLRESDHVEMASLPTTMAVCPLADVRHFPIMEQPSAVAELISEQVAVSSGERSSSFG